VATAIVREALAGTGIEVVASSPIAAYDARAPEEFRGSLLVPGARGVIVAGSAGPALWRAFRAHVDANPSWWDRSNPYDAYVDSLLDRADVALSRAGVRFRRFEAAFHATVRVNFVALAEIVGLGSPAPFPLLIHETHGPWWALRGAWIVDADVEPPPPHRPPCSGCPAPCIGGRAHASNAPSARPEVRARCVVGQSSRYDDDQIAYHYDRANTVARLRKREG
jgi:epoxyqueuosine reductase QueG